MCAITTDSLHYLTEFYALRDGWSRPLGPAVPRPMSLKAENNLRYILILHSLLNNSFLFSMFYDFKILVITWKNFFI